MYEAHFGFHRQPFQSADACRAFFVSESIQEILPQLLHALRSDLGIAVLTGVPGSGKTSLLRHIQQQLAREGRVIVCSGANLGTSADLIGSLLQASRMTGGVETTSKAVANERIASGSRISALDHMKRTAELWGPVLLLIDDVQLVPLPVLNELRACTEEEWNGRDLMRCLVSAPISFEDQLARAEYADFARRIRCHAFLQPLKSSESILFLKEQIELAGGKISSVFTTSALESITAAAGGNPRCLGLLADETLVVAAMVGEKIATEKSVRTALSRLQHLQYNWNTSPHMDSVETRELDSEPTEFETALTETKPRDASQKTNSSSSSTVTSATVASSTSSASRFTPPIQATIAPGVIEFGGPANSITRPRVETSSEISSIEAAAVQQPVEPALPESMEASPLIDDHSDYIDVSGSVELPEDLLPSAMVASSEVIRSAAETSPESVEDQPRRETDTATHMSKSIEFGALGPNTTNAHRLAGSSGGNMRPSFEVGQRFASEAMQESISIDDVEDRDILELLNLGADLDFVNQEPPVTKTPPALEYAEAVEAKIVWFNGNALGEQSMTFDATEEADVTFSGNTPELMTVETFEEDVPTIQVPPAAKLQITPPEADSINVASVGKFFDSANAKLSNRLPVFDRYTWLALGREVPAGRSSVVSMSATRQLIQADYAMLPSGSRATVATLGAKTQLATSIDQIPIIRTTDAALSAEIARNSLNVQSGIYLAIKPESSIVAETSTTREFANVESVSSSLDSADSFTEHVATETTHVDGRDGNSQTEFSNDSSNDSTAPDLQSASGLRIWRDGMLVFSNDESVEQSSTTDSGKTDSGTASQVSMASQPQGIETSSAAPTETAIQRELASSSSADEGFLQRNLLHLGAGGFFTLPDPKPQHADELQTLKISQDEDVYPFVEAINNMRADVRSFHDTGSVPVEDLDSSTRSPQSADSASQPDNVVSRAKRRLDDRANSADTKTVALQMSPEVRTYHKAQTELESVSACSETTETAASSRFGNLFTRLREVRKLAADQSQADAK